MHMTKSQQKAETMKGKILEEAKELGDTKVTVLALHEAWAPVNGWTILPILEHLYDTYQKDNQWVYFCEETTEIHLERLLEVLSRFNPQEKQFLGHSLHDHSPSIIHNLVFYADPTVFKFPDFDAGWAVSMELIKDAVRRLLADQLQMDFSIDIKHEVAMFFYQDGKGTNLTHVPEFCINEPLEGSKCASTINYVVPDCGITDADDILVSVKTCNKYHNDRIPIVKKTIGLHAKHIRYYSDVADENIPTEFIGVNNTETGHCQKLQNIISRFQDEEWSGKKWLVIIDDDTIMNFKRLQIMLSCYDPEVPLLIGERYGYGINYKNWGYSFPTGGGGMIMSKMAVKKLRDHRCPCHSVNAPDDMWLGGCFCRMGIPMIHTNSFHQTQPKHYNKQFLSHRYLVSFHKHFPQDPMKIYQDYLSDDEMGVKNEL